MPRMYNNAWFLSFTTISLSADIKPCHQHFFNPGKCMLSSFNSHKPSLMFLNHFHSLRTISPETKKRMTNLPKLGGGGNWFINALEKGLLPNRKWFSRRGFLPACFSLYLIQDWTVITFSEVLALGLQPRLLLMTLYLMYPYCEFCVQNSSAIFTMSACMSVHQKRSSRDEDIADVQ